MSKLAVWGVFLLFVVVALATGWHDRLLLFEGRAGVAKAILWAIWLGFVGYSVYCSGRENLFKTIGVLGKLYWGRQIGMDLYISATLSLALIYLNSGSWLVVALWLLPTVIYVNQAILLYVLIHFEQILSRFT